MLWIRYLHLSGWNICSGLELSYVHMGFLIPLMIWERRGRKQRFSAHFLQRAAAKAHQGEFQLFLSCRGQKGKHHRTGVRWRSNPYQPLVYAMKSLEIPGIFISSKSGTKRWKPRLLKCRCLRTFWKPE